MPALVAKFTQRVDETLILNMQSEITAAFMRKLRYATLVRFRTEPRYTLVPGLGGDRFRP